jgi:ankyrin repeat protein
MVTSSLTRVFLAALLFIATVHPQAKPGNDEPFKAAILDHDVITLNGLFEKRRPERIDILVEYAIDANDVAAVKMLLRYGADPDADLNGQTGTPLMQAAVKGHAEIIDQLIKAGADPNRRSGFGVGAWFPLLLAVEWQNGRAVDALLRGGADPNMRDGRQDVPSTPLMRAAYRGDPVIVGLLLKAGASPEYRDANGRRALDWLKKYKSPVAEIEQLLRTKKGRTGS